MNELFLGDNLDIIKCFPDNKIDAVVTDPPYGINFLNKKWDYDVPTVEFWEEVYRVLKPGGHILVFCGTRTQHRMAVNIEDAGFEIRDILSWLYGQGFPHGYNIAKGIEGIIKSGNANTTEFKDLKGDEKEKGLGYSRMAYEQGARPDHYCKEGTFKTNVEFETDEANYWDGWNTALKPACEFITLARKPISERNVPLNVLKWGTGGINIDATRIELNGRVVPINKLEKWSGFGQLERPKYKQEKNEKGLWPSNLIIDEVAKELIEEQHEGKSRFFYVAKASKKEKNMGLDKFKDKIAGSLEANLGKTMQLGGASLKGTPKQIKPTKNVHPTVKPIKLMEYLVKLIVPHEGICLDPYMGSGTTGIACVNNNVNFIGIERNEEYFEIANARIEYFKIANERISRY